MTKRQPLSEEDLMERAKALRMYVLVRRDVLPLVHCGVQAGHAVAEFVHYHQNDNTKKWVEEDKTLICLEATDGQIEKMKKYFADRSMNYQPFHEPDMSNLQTAVAFQPISTEDGAIIFKDFKLVS